MVRDHKPSKYIHLFPNGKKRLSELNEYELRFYRFVSSTTNRGIEMILSYDEWASFQNKPCFYCGDISGGIDRIDSNGIYELSNCVTACANCNIMKNSTPLPIFLHKTKLIASRHSH